LKIYNLSTLLKTYVLDKGAEVGVVVGEVVADDLVIVSKVTVAHEAETNL
jgi:cell shape-determining protein MreC